MHPHSPSDDADEPTMIEDGPHWSARPLMALPRAVPVSNVRVAVPPPVPSPRRLPPPPVVIAATRVPFYSYAEEQASGALDTECVAPLPMYDDSTPSLRPDWQLWIAARWKQLAVPACGVVAGLILVVGYLALGGNRQAVAASARATTPVVHTAPIVMHVDAPAPAGRDAAVRAAIALARKGMPTPAAGGHVDIEEAATTGTIAHEPAPAIAMADDADAVDEIEMEPAPAVRVKRVKRVATSDRRESRSKRPAIRFNASTPLGDLRPSSR